MKSIVGTLALATYIGSAAAYPHMERMLAERDESRLAARGATAFPKVRLPSADLRTETPNSFKNPFFRSVVSPASRAVSRLTQKLSSSASMAPTHGWLLARLTSEVPVLVSTQQQTTATFPVMVLPPVSFLSRFRDGDGTAGEFDVS